MKNYWMVSALVLMLSITFVNVLKAQRMDPEAMQERMVQQAEETIGQLELTEEQTPQVRTILLAGIEKRMVLMGGARSSGGWQSMRESMVVINQETTEQLAEILSEEQMAKYAKIQEERASRRRMRQN